MTLQEAQEILGRVQMDKLDIITVQLSLLGSRLGVRMDEIVEGLAIYAMEKEKAMGPAGNTEADLIDKAFDKMKHGGNA